jgi:hypothetical protein
MLEILSARHRYNFCSLPAESNFRSVLEAWLLLWICRVGLWVAPFPWVLEGTRFCAACLPSRRALTPAGAVAAIGRALPLTLRASCLTQALAGWIMLTRHGVVGRIRIGVASPEDLGFKAHAWLEVGGRVILGDIEDVDADGGLDSYHVIWTLPAEEGTGS